MLLVWWLGATTVSGVLARHPWRAGLGMAVLLYAPSYLDGSEYTAEGRPWPAFARLPLWRSFVRSVFGASVVLDDPHCFDDARRAAAARQGASAQYVIGVHPHGVYGGSHMFTLTDGCGAYSRVLVPAYRRHLVAGVLFKIPLMREWCLWCGAVDAGRRTAAAVLQSGRSMVLYPGGEREQVATRLGEHRVVVGGRTGFVRLALQQGSAVVPAYCFGEVDLYRTFSWLHDLRMRIVAAAGVALPLFWGRLGPLMPLLPLRGAPSLTLVVGRPQACKRTPEPTDAQVQELLGRYEAELRRVFEAYKGRDGFGAAGKQMLVAHARKPDPPWPSPPPTSESTRE